MREFSELGDFAVHLAERAVATELALHEGLEKSLKLIENTARKEFGTYQPETGPFPAWAELAESTKDDRLKHGYTENDPLLRSGELRDASSHEAQGLEGVAGSTDERMPYLEFGTSKMPPRPIWGPAAVKSRKKVEMLLGTAILTGLVGGEAVHASLGYDMGIGGEIPS